MYRCVLVVCVVRGSSVQMCVSCVCCKRQQCTDVCVGRGSSVQMCVGRGSSVQMCV